MSSLNKVSIAIVIILILGYFAKSFNENNHMKMALAECGSHEKIAKVDSKSFQCKKT